MSGEVKAENKMAKFKSLEFLSKAKLSFTTMPKAFVKGFIKGNLFFFI